VAQQNQNLVTAELCLALTEDPDFSIVSSRGVEIDSIARLDVGKYRVALTRAIPEGSLHIARQGRQAGKVSDEPRHTFALLTGLNPEGAQEYLLYCYDLSGAPDETDCIVWFAWHASPEVPAVVLDMEPFTPVPP